MAEFVDPNVTEDTPTTAVDVDGVGTLHLPSSMSKDEMAQAIESHPRVQEYKALYPYQNSWGNAANVGATGAVDAISSMPMIGAAFDPQVNETPNQKMYTDSLTQFRRDYPKSSAVLRALGDVGGTAAAYSVMPEAKVLPEALEKVGGPIARYLWDVGETGLKNTGVTFGDIAAHKGKDTEASDLGSAALTGFGTAGATELLGRGISPRAVTGKDLPSAYLNSMPGNPKMTRSHIDYMRQHEPLDYEDLVTQSQGWAENAAKTAKAKGLSPETQSRINKLTSALGGAAATATGIGAHSPSWALPFEIGMGLMGGREIGDIAGPVIQKGYHSWLNNQFMGNPNAQEILNILGGASSVAANRKSQE